MRIGGVNVPRIRPAERDAIAKLLEEPADSVMSLATDVLREVDRLREKRTDWFVLVIDPGVGVCLHGAFITKAAAHKAISTGDVCAASAGATALTLQLIKHDEMVQEAL